MQGAAMVTCATCGTFAIGKCRECAAPVCGDHSRLVEDERLCRACAGRRDATLRARAEMERQEEERRAEKKRAARADAIRAIADPIERFVVVMGMQQLGSVPSIMPRAKFLVGRWEAAVLELCPERRGADGRLAYDSGAVARWFVERASAGRLESTTFEPVVEKKGFLRGERSVRQPPVKAWLFPEAVNTSHRGESGPAGALFILEDGRIFGPDNYGGMRERSDLPPAVLVKMASMLGLKPPAPATRR
jgi:hypothetical protein